MRTLTRRVVVAVVVGLLGAVVLSAQDAASEVRKVMDGARAAAAAKDAKAYERFIADDLRWVQADGRVWTKQERLKDIPTAGTPPTLNEADIKVAGDVATVVSSTTASDGSRNRVVRTYVKRDGRWQLLLHAGFPMKK
jgi:ketosteroid isomerase-like protein